MMPHIPAWDYRDPFVKIYDNYILISCLPINMAFHREQREFLEDFLSLHLRDKNIVIRAMDGENLENLGFLEFFRDLCKALQIPPQRVTVISSQASNDPWLWIPAPLTIFWSADTYMGPAQPPLDRAKLFGVTIGRFNPLRHRLLQILHAQLVPDIFVVCNYTQHEVADFYQKITDQDHGESQWLLDRPLDQDPDLPSACVNNGTIPWQIACKSYGSLSSHWQIEIVVETDFYSPTWFTEKTSKCLYHGKPFVLVGGKGSLQHIRDMGFSTFDGIIDESYDQESTHHARIDKICQALLAVKRHPNKQKILRDLTDRARQNLNNWHTIKQRHYSQC